jgi:hypothetical protein
MKLKNHLPTFNVNTTECRTFLKQIDLVLEINDGIPKDKWPRVFLYIIKDVTAATWIKQNIIDNNLNWDESKMKFISHFQRADYSALLINKYDNIKQLKDETVQSYSDRFTDVCTELDRPDDDPLVISHYIKHIHNNIMKQNQHHLTTVRINKMEREFQYKSLKEVIEICIMFDVQSTIISSNTPLTTSTLPSDQSNDLTKKLIYEKQKYCTIHNSPTHDTSECNLNKKNVNEFKLNSDSSTTKSYDKSNIICVKCQQKGHYANECTLNKGVTISSTPSGTSSSNTTFNVANREKREIKPPQRLTYDKFGDNTAVTSNGGVTMKRALICARASTVTKQSGIWLLDVVNNRKFTTLIDTGAGVSFIDADLARELKLNIIPSIGEISLASSTTKVQRQGLIELPFIAMIGKSDLNASNTDIKVMKHKFELLKLDTSEHHFIIGRDLLPTLFPNGMPTEFYTNGTIQSITSDVQANSASLSLGGDNAETVGSSALLDEEFIDSVKQWNDDLQQQNLDEKKELVPQILEDYEIQSLQQWNQELDQQILEEHGKIQDEILQAYAVTIRDARINQNDNDHDNIIKVGHETLDQGPNEFQWNNLRIPNWLRQIAAD